MTMDNKALADRLLAIREVCGDEDCPTCITVREAAAALTSPQADKARGEVAYAIQCDDGSFFNKISPVDWMTFGSAMDAMRAEPWVVSGKAKIVPLYATPHPQGDARKRTDCGTCGERIQPDAVTGTKCACTPKVSGGGECNCASGRGAEHCVVHAPSDTLARYATPQARPDGGEIKWPERLVNLPCPDGTGDRILGFRIPDGDPILGDYGLSEPLEWLRSVTIERHPAPAPDVARLVEAAKEASSSLHLHARSAYCQSWDDADRETLTALDEALAPFTAAQQEATNGQE